MKKWTFFAMAVLSVCTAKGQKRNEQAIPAIVKAGFSKQYPAVKNIKWEKEKNDYEAGFSQNGIHYSVVLNEKGTILETEEEISLNSLPAPVKQFLSKNYPKGKIMEAACITDAKGVVTYEAEVKGKDLIFDKSGKLIKQ